VSGVDLPDLGVVAGRQRSHPPGVAVSGARRQKEGVGARILGAKAALVELDLTPGGDDAKYVAARPAGPRSAPSLGETGLALGDGRMEGI
jgi:hypothetical protein